MLLVGIVFFVFNIAMPASFAATITVPEPLMASGTLCEIVYPEIASLYLDSYETTWPKPSRTEQTRASCTDIRLAQYDSQEVVANLVNELRSEHASDELVTETILDEGVALYSWPWTLQNLQLGELPFLPPFEGSLWLLIVSDCDTLVRGLFVSERDTNESGLTALQLDERMLAEYAQRVHQAIGANSCP